MAPEADLIPHLAADLAGQRAIVLAPAPGVETSSCGGALALHRRAGDHVRVEFLTSDAASEAEAGDALKALGVAEHAFWRLPAGGLTADGALVARLHEAVLRWGAALVYAPSPLDADPDHRAVAQALRLALAAAPGALRVAFYESSAPIPVDHLVDVTSALEAKRAALAVYADRDERERAVEGFGAIRALALGPGVAAAEGFRVVDARRLDADRIWRHAALLEAPAPAKASVSVVLRTRDRPAQLREALGSVAAQELRDVEVVLVDDGGTDVSAVLGQFPELRIRTVLVAEPGTRGAALRAGADAAHGKLLAWLDDEDVLLPGHLAALRDALERTPQADVAYTGVEVVRLAWDAERLEHVRVSRDPVDVELDLDRLLFDPQLPAVASVVRRKAYRQAGGHDPALDAIADWDLLLRLSRQGPLVRVEGRTAEVRLRAGTPSAAVRAWGQELPERDRRALHRRHRSSYGRKAQVRLFGRLSQDGDAARAEAAALREAVLRLEGERLQLEAERTELTGRLVLAESSHDELAALRAQVTALQTAAALPPAPGPAAQPVLVPAEPTARPAPSRRASPVRPSSARRLLAQLTRRARAQ